MLEKAILKINPTAQFSINLDDINQIDLAQRHTTNP
jgi:hypothetical protein